MSQETDTPNERQMYEISNVGKSFYRNQITSNNMMIISITLVYSERECPSLEQWYTL